MEKQSLCVGCIFTMILQGQLSWYLYKSLLNYVHSWRQHYLDPHICRLCFIHCHSPVHKCRCFIPSQTATRKGEVGCAQLYPLQTSESVVCIQDILGQALFSPSSYKWDYFDRGRMASRQKKNHGGSFLHARPKQTWDYCSHLGCILSVSL